MWLHKSILSHNIDFAGASKFCLTHGAFSMDHVDGTSPLYGDKLVEGENARESCVPSRHALNPQINMVNNIKVAAKYPSK